MVTKREGRVEYAALQFGGLFGLGSDYYPLPWDVLTYDTEQGGYVADLEKKVLEQAPRYGADSEPTFDRDYGREVYGHYGLKDRKSGVQGMSVSVRVDPGGSRLHNKTTQPHHDERSVTQIIRATTNGQW